MHFASNSTPLRDWRGIGFWNGLRFARNFTSQNIVCINFFFCTGRAFPRLRLTTTMTVAVASLVARWLDTKLEQPNRGRTDDVAVPSSRFSLIGFGKALEQAHSHTKSGSNFWWNYFFPLLFSVPTQIFAFLVCGEKQKIATEQFSGI